MHRRDRVGIALFQIKGRGIEKKFQVRFLDAFFQKNCVEDHCGPLPVAEKVFLEDLVDDSALARPAVVVAEVRSGAKGPEANLARGVATEHRSVLDENNFHALARSGDRTARASESAAHDDEVRMECLRAQFAAVGSLFDDHGR